MASTGPLYPSLSTSGLGWSGTTNIFSDNNINATVAPSSISTALLGANYGFAIPSTDVINGLKFEIGRYGTRNNIIYDYTIQLSTDFSTTTGTNKADTGTAYTTSETNVTYGSSTDNWGLTLTPAIVNSSQFAVYYRGIRPGSTAATINIDYFRVTIYYSTSGGASSTYSETMALGLRAGLAVSATACSVSSATFGAAQGLSFGPSQVAEQSLSFVLPAGQSLIANQEQNVNTSLGIRLGLSEAITLTLDLTTPLGVAVGQSHQAILTLDGQLSFNSGLGQALTATLIQNTAVSADTRTGLLFQGGLLLTDTLSVNIRVGLNNGSEVTSNFPGVLTLTVSDAVTIATNLSSNNSITATLASNNLMSESLSGLSSLNLTITGLTVLTSTEKTSA